MAYCQKYIDDIDRILKQVVDKDNKQENLANFNRSAGVRESLNENLIPEQLFDDPNTKEKEAEGISAVKALQIASKEGQTIYTINQDNYSQILPKLNHSSDVMRDVANAVNAGRNVVISERQIRAFGWSGTGFIVLDSYTGYGAYLIDGGMNGGHTDFKKETAAFLSGVALAISSMMVYSLFAGAVAGLTGVIVMKGAVIYAAILASVLITLTIAFVVRYLESEYMWTDKETKCYNAGRTFVESIDDWIGSFLNLLWNPYSIKDDTDDVKNCL